MTPPPIRVVVVDDSRVIQGVLRRMLSRLPGLEVVATAENVAEARYKIAEHRPDVVTLDINMPGMNGLDYLEQIMTERPIPVVILSADATPGSAAVARATEAGAAAIVAKPEHGTTAEFQQMLASLERAIFRAARRRPSARSFTSSSRASAPPRHRPAPVTAARGTPRPGLCQDTPIFIGSSTGGPQALREILNALPPNMPPIIIAQHMPSNFTESLARRLNDEVALEVAEARSGESLVPGRVLVAPGHVHLKVRANGSSAYVHTVDEIPGHLYRPSVDVLMTSAARAFGPRCIGVLLTGMGTDGAAGLRTLRDHGAHTVVQDQVTSMIFGMPRAAIEAGAAETVCSLGRIADQLCEWLTLAKAAAKAG